MASNLSCTLLVLGDHPVALHAWFLLLSCILRCLCMLQLHWCSGSCLWFLHLCLRYGCAWITSQLCKVVGLAYKGFLSCIGIFIAGSTVTIVKGLPHHSYIWPLIAWNLLSLLPCRQNSSGKGSHGTIQCYQALPLMKATNCP